LIPARTQKIVLLTARSAYDARGGCLDEYASLQRLHRLFKPDKRYVGCIMVPHVHINIFRSNLFGGIDEVDGILAQPFDRLSGFLLQKQANNRARRRERFEQQFIAIILASLLSLVCCNCVAVFLEVLVLTAALKYSYMPHFLSKADCLRQLAEDEGVDYERWSLCDDLLHNLLDAPNPVWAVYSSGVCWLYMSVSIEDRYEVVNLLDHKLCVVILSALNKMYDDISTKGCPASKLLGLAAQVHPYHFSTQLSVAKMMEFGGFYGWAMMCAIAYGQAANASHTLKTSSSFSSLTNN